MSKRIFEEKQRFNQPFIYLLFGITACVIGYKSYQETASIQIGTGEIIFLCVAAFIFIINLKTRIDEEGIHIKMFPIHFSYKKYKWKEVGAIKVVTYSPLMDYGGWGIRISFKKGTAYNTRGDKGIKIQMKNGDLRMIGTQKKDEAQDVINHYFKTEEN